MGELLKNPFVISIVSLIAGIIINSLFTSIRNKSGLFGYTTFFSRLGISADDSIFGSVRVIWQGHQVRNLYSYTIEVENLTSRDYEHVGFKIFAGVETVILNEKTEIIDTPYIIKWSDAYIERMTVQKGKEPSKQQIEEYYSNREYDLPVFNRGKKLRFTYLCTRPNDDREPDLYISTPSKGVKLTKQKSPFVLLNPIFGVPMPKALSRAFFICIVAVLLCGFFLGSVWASAVICMVIGLSGSFFGAIFYKIERFLRNLIAG